jgi:hypothetical protein
MTDGWTYIEGKRREMGERSGEVTHLKGWVCGAELNPVSRDVNHSLHTRLVWEVWG